jgi:hypothetical protein
LLNIHVTGTFQPFVVDVPPTVGNVDELEEDEPR